MRERERMAAIARFFQGNLLIVIVFRLLSITISLSFIWCWSGVCLNYCLYLHCLNPNRKTFYKQIIVFVLFTLFLTTDHLKIRLSITKKALSKQSYQRLISRGLIDIIQKQNWQRNLFKTSYSKAQWTISKNKIMVKYCYCFSVFFYNQTNLHLFLLHLRCVQKFWQVLLKFCSSIGIQQVKMDNLQCENKQIHSGNFCFNSQKWEVTLIKQTFRFQILSANNVLPKRWQEKEVVISIIHSTRRERCNFNTIIYVVWKLFWKRQGVFILLY